MPYQRISCEDAKLHFDKLNAEQAQTDEPQGYFIDIRDPQAYALGRIPSSRHIDNMSINDFLSTADYQRPVFVLCYHGNSSQGAANHLSEQGFDHCFSINGGFTQWQNLYPNLVEKD